MKKMSYSVISFCLFAVTAGAVEYARSPNFVVMAPDRALAGEVLAKAEEFRAAVAKEWLGDELPPGVGPAMINVRLSESEDRGITWAACGDSARQYHRVWLNTSRARAIGGTLKHEVTHVVLATRFPARLAPWVEEGIAGRYDGDERVAIRRRTVAWYAKTQNWPNLAHVLNEPTIAADEIASYSLAGSLVEFFLSRADAATFIRFARDGNTEGWDRAVARHYGIENVASLQAAWQKWEAGRMKDEG